MSDKFNNSRGFDKDFFENFYQNKAEDEMNIINKNDINYKNKEINKNTNDTSNLLKNFGNEMVKKLKMRKIDFDYDQENLMNEIKGSDNVNITCKSPITDFDFYVLLTQKNIQNISYLKNSICNDYHYFFKKNNESSNELNDFNDSFSSSKLLEDYFLIKRNIYKVDFNDIVTNFLHNFFHYLIKLFFIISVLFTKDYFFPINIKS